MQPFKLFKQLITRKKPTRLRIPYDPAYKSVLEVLTPEGIQFFLPELYANLDHHFAPRFAEQELRSQIKGRAGQLVDKLVLVRLATGEMRLVLLHIEFESHPRNVPKRMFDYYCLLRDLDLAALFPDLFPTSAAKRVSRRRNPTPTFDITSLVIYVGNYVPKVYDHYAVSAFGTSNIFRFNTYIVRDMSEEALKANPNPFSIVILATKYVNQTFHDDEKRLTHKEKVYQLAAERGLERQKADAVLAFIDELLRLPLALEMQFGKSSYTLKPTSTGMYLTENSLIFANTVFREHYGYTPAELEARHSEEMAQTEFRISEKDSVISAKDSVISEKDAVIILSIVRLHTKRQMPVEEIADLMGVTPAFVTSVLVEKQAL